MALEVPHVQNIQQPAEVSVVFDDSGGGHAYCSVITADMTPADQREVLSLFTNDLRLVGRVTSTPNLAPPPPVSSLYSRSSKRQCRDNEPRGPKLPHASRSHLGSGDFGRLRLLIGTVGSGCLGAGTATNFLIPLPQPLLQVIPTRMALATMVRVGFTAAEVTKKLGVDHIEVVQLVGLAPGVEHRAFRVGARTARCRPGGRCRRAAAAKSNSKWCCENGWAWSTKPSRRRTRRLHQPLVALEIVVL